MSVVHQNLRLTEDHTLESSSGVISQLNLNQRLPPGSKEEILRSLNFENEQESKKIEPQFVFQGQCLVLGDSRVGKTSLVKSLTGKPFDVREPRTQGIQRSLVDRKWNDLDINESLQFGKFNRFTKALLQLIATYGPGNTKETAVIPIEIADWPFLLLSLIISLFSLYALLYDNRIIGWLLTLLCYALAWVSGHSRGFISLLDMFASIVRPHELVIGAAFVRELTKSLKVDFVDKTSFANTTESDQAYLDAVTSVSSTILSIFLYEGIYRTIWYTSFGTRLSIVKPSNIPGQKESAKVNLFVFLHIFGQSLVSLLSGIILGGVVETFTNVYYKSPRYLFRFAIVAIIMSFVLQSAFRRRLLSITFLVQVISCCMGVYWINNSCSLYVVMLVVSLDRAVSANWGKVGAFLNSDPHTKGNLTFLEVTKVILQGKKLKYALNEKFSTLTLTFLDFAGDKEYYAYHHMFLRSQAIYVIVFNMESFAQDNFRNVTKEIQTLFFWLESVCVHVQSKMPIFLAGTHRDNLGETCVRTLDGHLRKELWHFFCDELVMNHAEKLIYFPVENSQGQNDTGIQIFKERIMSMAEAYKKTIGRDIPYSWIQIQDAIIDHRKRNTGKFCVTLDEFSKLESIIGINWSQETLKYLHEKGLVIYVDKDPELCRWVLLNPEILVGIIITLVAPPTDEVEERGVRRDWVLLHNTGMLTVSLLKHILSRVPENKEALTSFLVEYDLICSLSHDYMMKRDIETGDEEQHVTHFIPSLLPLSIERNRPVWHDDSHDKKFYVFFKRFLPEPLFHRLLSRAHKNSRVEFQKGKPNLNRDVGVFWMSPWQPYKLVLLKEENMIEVTLSCRLVLTLNRLSRTSDSHQISPASIIAYPVREVMRIKYMITSDGLS